MKEIFTILRRVAHADVLPDISIRQLEYLLAVERAPTWAAAAEQVGVSASALSQGLAELERRIGVSLFESVGRRRVLRGAARPVLDHARQVVSLTGDLVSWAERVRRASTGSVRVGMIDVAAVLHFPDVLREFRAEHPQVEWVMSVAPSAMLLRDLAAGDLDLVVCVRPDVTPPGIEVAPLLSEEMTVFAPPSTEIGPPATWGPWILFPTGSHSRRLVEDALHELGAPVRVAAESHQPDVIGQMVELGLGWTVLPKDPGVAADVVTGPTVVSRELVIARRSTSVHDPAAQLLADRLAAGRAGRRSPVGGDQIVA